MLSNGNIVTVELRDHTGTVNDSLQAFCPDSLMGQPTAFADIWTETRPNGQGGVDLKNSIRTGISRTMGTQRDIRRGLYVTPRELSWDATKQCFQHTTYNSWD